MGFESDMDVLDAHVKQTSAVAPSVMDEPATPNDFESDIEFRTFDGVQRTADRYIWFAGQLMIPAVMKSRPDFAVLGGEYFGNDYPALSLSKYTLFRCRITPITLRPRLLPVDEKIKNKEIEAFQGVAITKGEIAPARVQYVKAFPGDQLETIVFGSRDGATAKGYVEITALRGSEYSQKETKQLLNETQIRIFPNWMEIMRGTARLPVTLRETEDLIREAAWKYADDELVSSVCADMLGGCEQFRAWGVGRLQMEGTQIRAGVNPNGGYIHHYTPVAELLLAQLEMRRENLLAAPEAPANNQSADKFAEAAAAMAATAQANAEAARHNNEFLQKILENQAAIGAQLGKGAGTEAVAEAKVTTPKK